MLSEGDLATDLKKRFGACAAILYGSATSGSLRADSDVDVVCFGQGPDRFPMAYLWSGLLVDAWIHPMTDAEQPESFLKLHDGRVLFDHERAAETLLAKVVSYLQKPRPKLDDKNETHRRAWIWKMFDRATWSGPEADHRRHWLLADLPETWCDLTERHYLGPKNALARMRIEADGVYDALESALTPGASLPDIERAVRAIVGPRAV